jgi:ABC-2 type transport system ATP-binding protein
MIIIKDLSKKYGKKQVLKKVNLTINDGDIYAFVGSNGAGKTTTIKSMLGILPFDGGDVLYDNVSIKDEPLKIKQDLAYIPDNPDIYEHLTGLEYLSFIADMYETDTKTKNENIKKYSKLLEIDTKLNDKIGSYSHGMIQKIVIIAALVHEPKVIIMDEPFVGLDPLSTHTLKELMKDAQLRSYGDGLDPEFLHPYMWCCKGHYYSTGLSFYNFTYAFGQLFAYGLYNLYKEKGAEEFFPLYKKVLINAGQMPIRECVLQANIDVEDINFWRKSLDICKGHIEEFLELTK